LGFAADVVAPEPVEVFVPLVEVAVVVGAEAAPDFPGLAF
jgi:hypothetical protein